MDALTARKVAALGAPGLYGDGGGLYLRVGPSGSKSWILRTVVHGHRRSLGLGSAKLVTLAEAREAALGRRKVARSGGDPIAARARETLTFAEAAWRVHANLAPTWRNPKHAAQWLASLETYAFPRLGARPVATVGTADVLAVLAVLAPIWTAKPETAARVRQRLSAVFDWARAGGHYAGENPVAGVRQGLAPVRHRPSHMAALPWREFARLHGRVVGAQGPVGAHAGAGDPDGRSGEARGMAWAEVQGDLWTIPADRMKAGRAHRVPLSPQALGVLDAVRGLGAALVFPATVRGGAGPRAPRPARQCSPRTCSGPYSGAWGARA